MSRACSVRGCNDAATVTVDRDGKPYCRGHGLAEAAKRPISDITPIQDELSPSIMGLLGSCPACGGMVNMVQVGEERVALDYSRLRRSPVAGDALLRFQTGTGRIIEEGDDLDQVKGWIESGRVALHRLHAPFCIGTKAHRRDLQETS